MRIRLTQLDGKLPNLALMKLAAYHRARGATVQFTRSPHAWLGDSAKDYDIVYGSAIFSFSAERVRTFKYFFPAAIVGGTWDITETTTVESIVGDGVGYDYSDYPEFTASIGFTQRGCRLRCGFCVVPRKEGKPATVATIADIWRGPPWPRHLHLLDNDFFGQPREQWQARIGEIKRGEFKVCLNQGINVRMIDEEAAAALASIPLYDDGFRTRRLYTAWDNIGDEQRFFDGVAVLARAGIQPRYLLAYMLIGYDKRETWERVLYRFERMTALGIRPYPMIYGERRRGLPLGGTTQQIGGRTLAEFQRWAIRKYYTVVSFEKYDPKAKGAGIIG